MLILTTNCLQRRSTPQADIHTDTPIDVIVFFFRLFFFLLLSVVHGCGVYVEFKIIYMIHQYFSRLKCFRLGRIQTRPHLHKRQQIFGKKIKR